MNFAARIAPEIDRLVLAVNVTGGNRIRTTATEMAQDLGLERSGILKHFPEFLLFATLDEAIAIARLPYRRAAMTAGDVEKWRTLGLVEGPIGAMVATVAVKPLLQLMLATTQDVATALWDAYPGVVDEASTQAASIVDRIGGEFAVAAAHRAVPLPDDRYLRLHRRLTTIRYARAWAHVAAWRAYDLDLDEIKTLTSLWHGGEVEPGPVVSALADRGLVVADGSGLTEKGKHTRDAIERATDENVLPVLEASGEEGRESLLESLMILPGSP